MPNDNFLTNVFGGVFSQLATGPFLLSASKKAATLGLMALMAKFGISDTSWVPGAAAAFAAIVVASWDSLQATPGKLALRTAALPGVTVKTPDGTVHDN